MPSISVLDLLTLLVVGPDSNRAVSSDAGIVANWAKWVL